MPKTLDDALRALAERGELTYLSIAPVAGGGPYGVHYSATVAAATKWGHSMARDSDPVQAIHKAIDGMKLPKVKPGKGERAAPAAEAFPWDG